MLKTILMLVVVALAAILVYAATRPDSFRVARSLGIAAPPEKIYPLINDLPHWREWPSPYLSKLIGVFMNRDTMIGGDFEAGLVNLKTLAES